MKRRPLILAIFLPLLLAGSLCAQVPNPPSGWQFVRNLDSLDVTGLHASGDTIFMYGHDAHATSYNHFFKIISFNGGKDWDTMAIPSGHPYDSYHWGFFPNEARMWLVLQDTSLTFYTTRNGKDYEKVIVGKDTTNAMGSAYSNFFIDPFDANHWLYIGEDKRGPGVGSLLSQSFDAWHSWQPANVPIISAEKSYLELVFDSRIEGVWYVHVIAIQHHTLNADTDYVVKTIDNGQTGLPPIL